jgi:hypothetical protein
MLLQYDLDFEPVFRRSDEVIGIADLLLRWPHNSFYHISYLTGLEKFEELDNPRLHMRLARRIGLDKETNKIIIYLQDLDRWMHMENAFANFDMLYFDLEEVKELEKNHIEHRIIDLERRNLDPLFTTTKRNIDVVGALVLYHWVHIAGYLNRDKPSYYQDAALGKPGEDVNHAGRWRINDPVIHMPPDEKFRRIPKGRIWPNLPVELPERINRKRDNKLSRFKPRIKELEKMGITVQKNQAKVLYFLHPYLSYAEIGKLFPAKDSTAKTKASFVDRGRVLLGKK